MVSASGMNGELSVEYLRPFRHRIWNQAVQEKPVFLFLVDYFTEQLYWHPNFPTIGSDLVLNSMVKKYAELSNLSKLDFHLCFPYIKYHENKVYDEQICKISNKLFQDTEVYVKSLTRESRLMILNSNVGEDMMKMKAKHIDLICGAKELETLLPEIYIDAVHQIQSGLQNMFARIHYEKEQLNAIGGLREVDDVDMFTSFPTEDGQQIITIDKALSSLFGKDLENSYQSQLNNSTIKPRRAVIRKPRKTQEEIAEEMRQNQIGIDRVREIMRREEQKHYERLAAQGGQSFQLLEAQDPNHPNYQKPKRRRDYTREREEREAKLRLRTFSKPQPPVDRVVNQPANDDIQIILVKKIPIVENVEEKILPGINAPSSVRLTGGGRAIMQPNPKLQQVMRQKEMDDQRLIGTNSQGQQVRNAQSKPTAQMNPQFVKTLVETENGMQMRLVEKITPFKNVEQGQTKIILERSSYPANKTPVYMKRVQKPIQTTAKVPRMRLTSVNGQSFVNNQISNSAKVSPSYSSESSDHHLPESLSVVKAAANLPKAVESLSDTLRNSNLKRKARTVHKTDPKPSNPLNTNEPTVRQVVMASMYPEYRARIPDDYLFTLNPSLTVKNNTVPIKSAISAFEKMTNGGYQPLIQNCTQKPISVQQHHKQLKKAEKPTTKPNQLDLSQFVDHEEIVSTSEDALFDLLEQHEKAEQAERAGHPASADDAKHHKDVDDIFTDMATEHQSIIDQALKMAMYPDDYEIEGTVHLEEVEDNGEMLFEEAKGERVFFTAEEIEGLMNPKSVEVKKSNTSNESNSNNIISQKEYAELQTAYPDLFNENVDQEYRRTMADFILRRLDNPNSAICQVYTIKVNETSLELDPPQTTELFFEMNFETMEWKRIQKTRVFRTDGVLQTVDYLDGPQNRTEVMLRNQSVIR